MIYLCLDLILSRNHCGLFLPVAHKFRNTWNGGEGEAYIHKFLLKNGSLRKSLCNMWLQISTFLDGTPKL